MCTHIDAVLKKAKRFFFQNQVCLNLEYLSFVNQFSYLYVFYQLSA